MLHETVLEGKALHLASSVTGNGLEIPNIIGAIILAVDAAGLEGSVDWMWNFYDKAGKPLAHKGQPFTNAHSLKECMTRNFETFSGKWLPLLWRLGIVGPRAGSHAP